VGCVAKRRRGQRTPPQDRREGKQLLAREMKKQLQLREGLTGKKEYPWGAKTTHRSSTYIKNPLRGKKKKKRPNAQVGNEKKKLFLKKKNYPGEGRGPKQEY